MRAIPADQKLRALQPGGALRRAPLKSRPLVAATVLVAWLGLWSIALARTIEPVTVRPRLETPALFDDDAGGNADADDPAIWVHPTTPEKSIVVATKKDAGLSVYDLGGVQLQAIAAPEAPGPDDAAGRFNNVDLVYGFQLGTATVDLAVVTDRGRDKLRIYTIDPEKAAQGLPPLTDVTDAAAPFVFSTTQADVNEQTTAYGLATYRNRFTGRAFAFVSQRSRTAIAKLELIAVGNQVSYRKVQQLALPNEFALPNGNTWIPCTDPGDLAQVEGMVVDQERGVLYAGQEDVGIWKMGLQLNTTTPVLLDRVREYGVPYTYDTNEEECVIDFSSDPGFGGTVLSADVEGLTIYYAFGNTGYLLASSQGDNTFAVYDRLGENAYLGSFAIGSNRIDSVQESDGAAVINVPLGSAFPAGLLVTQDGDNTPEVLDESGEPRSSTNFKYTGWAALARAFPTPLKVSPLAWNPRTGYRP